MSHAPGTPSSLVGGCQTQAFGSAEKEDEWSRALMDSKGPSPHQWMRLTNHEAVGPVWLMCRMRGTGWSHMPLLKASASRTQKNFAMVMR